MTTSELRFDPLSREQLDDPYPLYAQLRSDAPIFLDPATNLWIITRYDDVVAIAKDPVTFSSENAVRANVSPFPEPVQEVLERGWPLSPTLTDSDGDMHKRLRLLVSRAFTPKRISAMEEGLAQVVDELIEDFVATGRGDLIERFAWHLPMYAITDIIQVPRSDVPDLHRWSMSWLRLLQATDDMDVLVACAEDVVAMQHYFMDALVSRQEAPRDDFMSALLLPLSGLEPLSLEEAMRVPMNLIIAGHVTVTRALGNGLRSLLEHPEELRRLREQPELASTMVEEVLRFESPAQGLFRTVVADTEVNGTRLPEGSRLMLHWGSANRDEATFARPEAFDIGRDSSAHIAFGKGVHTCLGAPLARLQLRLALPRLLERLPNLRLVDDEDAVQRDTIYFARGFSRLVLEWDIEQGVR